MERGYSSISSGSASSSTHHHHPPHSRSRSKSPGGGQHTSRTLDTLGKIGENLGLGPRPAGHHRRHSSSSAIMSGGAGNDGTRTPPTGGLGGGPIGGDGGGGKKQAIQDRLFAKMVEQWLPAGYSIDDYQGTRNKRKADRTPFSLGQMNTNFRRFNARIGVVFVFQHRVIRMLQWTNPVHTLSALAVYTLICLDPYLLFVLPLTIIILFVMVPSFIVRHPPPPSGFTLEKYNAKGPASAPAPAVSAVSEMSKDFFRNLQDLQNTMGDYTIGHDYVIHTFAPLMNFQDERLSSGLFIALFITTIVMFIAAHLVPWRLVFLIGGWCAFASMHPALEDVVAHILKTQVMPQVEVAGEKAKEFAHSDITLATTAETREVEIFELQRRTKSGEYEPWMFSPKPYEPLSPERIAEERPKGTRFFEDVRCPPGWEWLEGKWTMDLGSLNWVQERFIVGVDVEDEGERWVYDYVEPKGRGEWRRRRWVRGVRRKYAEK